jgi:hypothetical protein
MVITPAGAAVHVANLVKSWVTLFGRLPVAVNCCVVPTISAGFGGATSIEITEADVSSVVPATVPKAAVIVTVPVVSGSADARPVPVTVAMASTDEVHATLPVKSCVAEFSRVAVAVNCCVVPDAIVESAGVIAIAETGDIDSVVEPEIPAVEAVMVVVPELISDEAVTSPASFTVATAVSLDVQVTSRVRFLVIVEKVPRAWS